MVKFGKSLGAIVAIGAVGMLSGCGGGGIGSGTTTYPLSGDMRILQNGDQWNYTLTGTIAQTSSTSLPVTGTAVWKVGSATFNGNTVETLTETVTFTAVTQTSTLTNVIYFTQDSKTGSITEVGDQPAANSQQRTAKTPVIIYPGVWTNPLTLTSNLVFTDNSTQNTTLTVNNTSLVDTPIGNFNTWQVGLNTISSVTGSISHTEWWAPEIGSFVQATISTPTTSGQLGVTLVLSSTNVPLS